MRLLYYCIVGDPLIYRVKGYVGETPFPQQTPPRRHPSHIQLITCLFLNTPPWSICHLYIAIQKLLLKTLWEKLRRNIITICYRKLLQKPNGKNIRRNHMTYVRTYILYCLIKNLVWETLGKTHKEKKSTISVIWRSSTSYNLGFYSPWTSQTSRLSHTNSTNLILEYKRW
jgi:hypothetical protein